jgi:HSP20 family molecular chaperone IbpA
MEYTIDKTIDRGSIEASLNQGVLTLTLGLSESVKPRKINVISK